MTAKLLRMRFHRLLPLLPLVLSSAASGTAITAHQVSSNAIEDGKPVIAAGQIAWQQGPDQTSEIKLFDGSGIVNVTSSPMRDIDPDLSGTFLVWKRSSNGTDCMLEVFDFDTTQQLDASFDCANDLRVAGPHVSWSDTGIASGKDVFVSTDLADPDRLGQAGVDDGHARVGDVAGNPRAVFTAVPLLGTAKLVYWNGSSEKNIADAPASALRSQIRMNGGRVVWTDVDPLGDDLEVFLYDGTNVVQLTHNDFDDEEPDVHGQDVVWRGFPDDPNSGEIYHFDGTTTVRVTNDDLDDRAPRVSKGADGTTIAWVKNDGGDEDVWVFDGCESSNVSGTLATTQDDDDVVIDGNEIAWVRGSGANTEIWRADVQCDVACGNGELEPGEECDDGNTADLDGCSSLCKEEICGNARIDPGETCDDGNTAAGDGCDADCILECGNGDIDPGEECDDGNRVNGDDCDAQCIEEVCGNGKLQSGEECDDHNTEAGDGCSSVCEVEQPIAPALQKCITSMNKQGAAVARAQHQVDAYCLGNAAKGTIPIADAQDCLAADPKGKVLKATDKVVATDAKKCPPGGQPTFGYTGATDTNLAGTSNAKDLVADLFGPMLNDAVIGKDIDKKAAACQKDTLTATTDLADRLYKLTQKEKTALLAGKEDGRTAISADALARQLDDFLTADAEGKIAKKQSSLRDTVRNRCANVAGLAAVFPGCAPANANGLADCAQAAARCRFCLAFDAMDAVAIDCDAFDDATANTSCP